MFDWIFEHANVLDGSGAPAFCADVAIQNGSIAAIGDLSSAQAAKRTDCTGYTLTPGFLDIHRHADAALFRPDFGAAELTQGLTTIINGNCGMSIAPISGPHREAVEKYIEPVVGLMPDGSTFPTLADYRRRVEQTPIALNTGMLVGMGTLRACTAGFGSDDLTEEQYDTLHKKLEQTVAEGACGVSLGLGYAPECFYTTEGLIRALEPLKDSGVCITVHMRQEGDAVVPSLGEMLSIAEALHTPVEISHLKAIGKPNWNRAVPEMLSKLADARQRGVEAYCDAYPYLAGSTQLIYILPPEVKAGGMAHLTQLLKDPEQRAYIRKRMEEDRDFENIRALVGFENIQATGLQLEQHRPFEGKSIAQIAQMQGKDPYDALFDLLAEEECRPAMIDWIVAEEDLIRIYQDPCSCVISDATYPTGGKCHPRVHGSVARFLERYVQEKQILPLEKAVQKLTRIPADRLGLNRKGRIEVGADADLCLFRPEEIHERATFACPDQTAQGMKLVLVNGEIAVKDGHITGIKNGRWVSSQR